MIIVSQDKDAIINFDKIANLVVTEKEIVSISDIKETAGITIAEYKSRERAKEILKNIAQNYVNECRRYEMPKE